MSVMLYDTDYMSVMLYDTDYKLVMLPKIKPSS